MRESKEERTGLQGSVVYNLTMYSARGCFQNLLITQESEPYAAS